jgi:hypothetical protein
MAVQTPPRIFGNRRGLAASQGFGTGHRGPERRSAGFMAGPSCQPGIRAGDRRADRAVNAGDLCAQGGGLTAQVGYVGSSSATRGERGGAAVRADRLPTGRGHLRARAGPRPPCPRARPGPPEPGLGATPAALRLVGSPIVMGDGENLLKSHRAVRLRSTKRGEGTLYVTDSRIVFMRAQGRGAQRASAIVQQTSLEDITGLSAFVSRRVSPVLIVLIVLLGRQALKAKRHSPLQRLPRRSRPGHWACTRADMTSDRAVAHWARVVPGAPRLELPGLIDARH